MCWTLSSVNIGRWVHDIERFSSFIASFCRTAKDNPPVTYAIAASETQNVSVSVLPYFGLTEESSVTAKDMWGKMVQVTSAIIFVNP